MHATLRCAFVSGPVLCRSVSSFRIFSLFLMVNCCNECIICNYVNHALCRTVQQMKRYRDIGIYFLSEIKRVRAKRSVEFLFSFHRNYMNNCGIKTYEMESEAQCTKEKKQMQWKKSGFKNPSWRRQVWKKNANRWSQSKQWTKRKKYYFSI